MLIADYESKFINAFVSKGYRVSFINDSNKVFGNTNDCAFVLALSLETNKSDITMHNVMNDYNNIICSENMYVYSVLVFDSVTCGTTWSGSNMRIANNVGPIPTKKNHLTLVKK